MSRRRSPIAALVVFLFGSVLVACGGEEPAGEGTIEQTTTTLFVFMGGAHAHHDQEGMGDRALDETRSDDGWYEWSYTIMSETTTEVSAFAPDAEPSEAERRAADELQRAVTASLRRWPTADVALADGFEVHPFVGETHLVNVANVEDGRVVDPNRPEVLVVDPSGRVHGAMFLAAGNSARGPQIGGPLTVWHYHPYKRSVCWESGGLLPAANTDGDQSGCPDTATFSARSPEMLHVWVSEQFDDPFSSDMWVLVGADPRSEP